MELNLYPVLKEKERESITQWFEILTNELSSVQQKENPDEPEAVNQLNWEALLFFKHLL